MFKAYKRYAGFEGRSGRKEYWLFLLWMLIGSIAAMLIDIMVFGLDRATDGDGFTPFSWLFTLANLVPCMAVSFRRLHDIGRSAWWILIGLIPIIGFIVLIVFYVTKSQPEANRFGPPEGDLIEPEPAVA